MFRIKYILFLLLCVGQLTADITLIDVLGPKNDAIDQLVRVENIGTTNSANFSLYYGVDGSGANLSQDVLQEILIGSAGEFLKVNAGVTGYEWGTPAGGGFDSTAVVGNTTWGDASTDTIVWTFDRATGTDPTITFNSGSIGLQALTLTTDLAVAEGGTGASDLNAFVLQSLFDADTFLYASSDNTPVATSPANVLAALSGHAGAEFDWGDQNLVSVGNVEIGDADGNFGLGLGAITNSFVWVTSKSGGTGGIARMGIEGDTLASFSMTDLGYTAVANSKGFIFLNLSGKMFFRALLDTNGFKDDIMILDLVTSNVTFGADVAVEGDFAINTNKFTVAAATGNTIVAGTFAVGANFEVDAVGNTMMADATITGTFAHEGSDVGFYFTAPIEIQTLSATPTNAEISTVIRNLGLAELPP